MRDYAKTGNRPGRPAYRTAASFRGKTFALKIIRLARKRGLMRLNKKGL